MAYDTTLNIVSPVDFLVQVNSGILNGNGGIGMLILIAAIFFMGFYYQTKDFVHSYGLSSLITAICSVLLLRLGMVNDRVVWFCWIFVAIAAFFYMFSKK